MPDAEPTAADRAFRVLADATGDSRPRRPGDADDPAIPVAATVVLLRDARRGPEALLIERPDRGAFAGAWVFPGGKLDPEDALVPGEPEEDVARRAGAREVQEEVGLRLDRQAMLTVSRWDPPPGLPLRIRTWFFATRAPEAEPVLSADEVASAEWMRPADVLERHGRGELALYPPTWVTLHDLADQDDVEGLLGFVRLRGVQHYESVARRSASGPMLLWQDDGEYAQTDAASSARHRLEVGALPWRYTRTG